MRATWTTASSWGVSSVLSAKVFFLVVNQSKLLVFGSIWLRGELEL